MWYLTMYQLEIQTQTPRHLL